MDVAISSTTGAALFWLYIAAALILTTAAIYTIASIKIDRKTATDVANTNYDTAVFTAWAIISFATISYNMVQVLAQSYEAWPLSQFYPSLSLDDPFGAIQNLWAWSTTSTPFIKFGQAIAGDDFGWLWAQSALLKTFSVSLYIAYEGPRIAVPNTWVFLGLAQILPVSFALNLFYLAQIRLPQKPHYPVATIPQPVIFGTATVFCACLIAAPKFAASEYLLPIILLARLALLVPAFATKTEWLAVDHPDPEQSGFGLYTAQIVMETAILVVTAIQGNTIVQREFDWVDLFRALFLNPAVTTLGLDLIFSMLSYGTWIAIQRHSFPEDEEPKEE